MLSAQDNEKLTRVGPGTPMGSLLRRHWLPALLEEELGAPDAPPVPLRLLGEDFVAFRDTQGRVGVLDAFCPHRRAPLFLGRNEECGLRCVYHGWKFDTTGACVDLPNEPPTSRLKERVQIDSYSVHVAGGVVWVYLGDPTSRPPRPPQLPWTELGPDRRLVSKRLQENNWVQAVEGGIDSSHIGFLHREWEPSETSDGERRLAPIVRSAVTADQQKQAMSLLTGDTSPRFNVESSDFGLWIGARRDIRDSDRFYWRITPFLVPFYTVIPPLETDSDPTTIAFDGHAWVPIDDENTWTYNISWREGGPFSPEEVAEMRSPLGTHGPVGEGFVPFANKRNTYLLDRDRQRTTSFTGIEGANTQDRAVQELMGPIVDRTKEHLGTTDRAIVAFRRMMLQLAGGDTTKPAASAPQHPERYRVRAASVILETDEQYVKEAGDALWV